MISAKINIDYSRFEKAMSILYEKVIPYMRVTWMEIAEQGLRTVVAYTPPTRPGRTSIRDLWFLEHTVQAKVEQFIIRNLYKDQRVLLWFEEGTKPHEIRPRYGNVLHFFLEDGTEIFTKLVYHPGSPAYGMVAQTERELNIRLDRYMEETMNMVDSLMQV
jgi:hypothetical protein